MVRGAAAAGRGASPTRSQRLHGGLSAPVERPDWSSVEPAPEAALEVAWRKRYAAELAVVAAHVDRDGPALDASTRLGELEWSIEHEDVRGLCDFLFRRTDVGYGTRADVEAASEQLLERAASRLDWNDARVEAERAELTRELDRLHGWRSGERP